MSDPKPTKASATPSSIGLSAPRSELLAQRILRACGVGKMAIIGEVPPFLLASLRMTGVTVEEYAFDESQYPSAGDAEKWTVDDVLIISSSLGPENLDIPQLKLWSSRATRSVALVLLADAAKCDRRADWEAGFIAMGLRKHPMLEVVAPYETLDQPTDLMMLLFEPVSPAAAMKYPLEALKAERDLHTDMTREAGRRSDAHMTRYAQAAQFVRPGDRVLDAACGLGYGSYILANSTRAASLEGLDASRYAVEYATTNFAGGSKPIAFREGDAESLSFLSDASIDFAVSVETLEHLLQPEALLRELMRVLTPGGRAYLSVPNNWADETGKDPNPFHHHVYDWTLLRQQLLDCGFIPERAWTQDAGGGQRLHHAMRAMREFSPESGPQQDGEWLLVLVIKPLPHREQRVREDRKDLPNIIAFNRDYRNPWLVRGLVAKGLRATSASVLSEMADATMKDADKAGADFGAALCVACYRALEDPVAQDRLELAQQALAFGEKPAINPTVLRWQVSLFFVAGLLFQREGKTSSAYSAFERVTRFDVLLYSPLLGTKTVAASFRLGVLSLAASDSNEARKWWLNALAEARRLVKEGDWNEVVGTDPEAPETFGLPELAGVLLEAAKAANGLRALSDPGTRPGLLWQIVQQTPDSLATLQQIEREVLEDWLAQLQTGKQWVENHAAAQVETTQQLAVAKEWLDDQYQALSNEVSRLRETNSRLSEGHSWLNDQYLALTAETARQREINNALSEDRARLLEVNDSLEQSRHWLESQYHALIAEVSRLEPLAADASLLRELSDTKYREITELQIANRELEMSRQWLDGQYHSLTSEIARLSHVCAQQEDSREKLLIKYREVEGSLVHLQIRSAEISDEKQLLDDQCRTLSAANAELLCFQKQCEQEIQIATARIRHLETGVVRRAWARLKSALHLR